MSTSTMQKWTLNLNLLINSETASSASDSLPAALIPPPRLNIPTIQQAFVVFCLRSVPISIYDRLRSKKKSGEEKQVGSF